MRTVLQELRLSTREQQILQAATEGLTDQAIAHHLGISLGTVGSYWTRIRGKIGPFNRAQHVAHYTQARTDRAIEQLRTENFRLIEEVHALSQNQHQTESALEAYKVLVDGAEDAMIVVDRRGVIRAANEAAEALLGYDGDELLEKSLADLVPVRFHGFHRENRELFMSHPEKRVMATAGATVATRKDGSEVAIIAKISGSQSSSEALAVCIMRELNAD